MEVSDIIANLAEACRKNYVRMVESGSSYVEAKFKAVEGPPLRFSAPVFDLGVLFDNKTNSPLFVNHTDQRSKFASDLLNQAVELAKNDEFSLPHPICFFVWEDPIAITGHKPYTILYCVENTDPYEMITVGFQYVENDIFYQLPMMPVFDKQNAENRSVKLFVDPSTELTGEMAESETTRCGSILERLATAVLLIEQKSTIHNAATPTRLVQSVNAGRARGKLAPLGSVTRITVDRNIQMYKATGRKGAPKSGADVRSHLRHLQSGKVIRVRAHSRKGGKLGQSIYEVR